MMCSLYSLDQWTTSGVSQALHSMYGSVSIPVFGSFDNNIGDLIRKYRPDPNPKGAPVGSKAPPTIEVEIQSGLTARGSAAAGATTSSVDDKLANASLLPGPWRVRFNGLPARYGGYFYKQPAHLYLGCNDTDTLSSAAYQNEVNPRAVYAISKRAGIFFGRVFFLVSSGSPHVRCTPMTRTMHPHGGASYVRGAGRNRIDRHGGGIERLATGTCTSTAWRGRATCTASRCGI